MMNCPKCGLEAREGTRFCRQCGFSLPQSADSTLAMASPSALGSTPKPQEPLPPPAPATVIGHAPNPTAPPAPATVIGHAPNPAAPPAPATVIGHAPNPAAPPAPATVVAHAPNPAVPPAPATVAAVSPQAYGVMENAYAQGGQMPYGRPAPQPAKGGSGKLFLMIGGVVVVGVLLFGALLAFWIFSAAKSTPSSTPSTSQKSPKADNPKIFDSYITRFDLSYIDTPVQNEDDSTKFIESNVNTTFPAASYAIVLHLEGDPPPGTSLKAVWTRIDGSPTGSKVLDHDIGDRLVRGQYLNLSIYKEGNVVPPGKYKVELRNQVEHVVARSEFSVGN